MLKGKKGVILGVANKFSIAWAAAKVAKENGAELIFSYQNEKLLKRVKPLAEELGADIIQLEVQDDNSIDNFANEVEKKFGKIDFVLHSIAFAKREDLKGNFSDTSRDGFHTAMDISVYSLIAATRALKPIMNSGCSIVTFSYYGADKVIPSYDVMGVAKAALECSVRYLANDLGKENIRVNAISAGPINTLSARGIAGFTSILDIAEEKSLLKRNVEPEEVGKTAVFLFSQMSSGVTGETIFVDCGLNKKGI